MHNIVYKPFTTHTTINDDEIMKLYESVQWSNYTQNPEMLQNACRNSLAMIGAWDGENLIGMIRVVGDGHSIIYIQDIIVRPDYQRQGIGTKLLNEILSRYSHVYQKILLTENSEKTVQFYESLGFKADCHFGCVAFCQFTM